MEKPITSNQIENKKEVVYTRAQKGHSAIVGWLILGPFTLFVLPIYWTISPNHYWHI